MRYEAPPMRTSLLDVAYTLCLCVCIRACICVCIYIYVCTQKWIKRSHYAESLFWSNGLLSAHLFAHVSVCVWVGGCVFWVCVCVWVRVFVCLCVRARADPVPKGLHFGLTDWTRIS